MLHSKNKTGQFLGYLSAEHGGYDIFNRRLYAKRDKVRGLCLNGCRCVQTLS